MGADDRRDVRAGALEFIDALGLSAQARTTPHRGREQPGQVPDAPASPARVWEVAPKPVNNDEDFL
jgi:hypothetical protein